MGLLDCVGIWEPQPPGTPRPVQNCNRIALPLITAAKLNNTGDKKRAIFH